MEFSKLRVGAVIEDGGFTNIRIAAKQRARQILGIQPTESAQIRALEKLWRAKFYLHQKEFPGDRPGEGRPVIDKIILAENWTIKVDHEHVPPMYKIFDETGVHRGLIITQNVEDHLYTPWELYIENRYYTTQETMTDTVQTVLTIWDCQRGGALNAPSDTPVIRMLTPPYLPADEITIMKDKFIKEHFPQHEDPLAYWL